MRLPTAPQDFALSHTLAEASDMIFSVAFSGRLLAAGSQDKQIRLYDAEKEPGPVEDLRCFAGEFQVGGVGG